MCLLALHSSSSVFAVELLSIQPSSWEHSSGHSSCIKLVEFVCMHVCSDQSLNAWCAWSMLAIAILRCYGCCLELFTMNICTYVCSIVVESLLALYMKLDHWIGGVTSAFCVDMLSKPRLEPGTHQELCKTLTRNCVLWKDANKNPNEYAKAPPKSPKELLKLVHDPPKIQEEIHKEALWRKSCGKWCWGAHPSALQYW